MSHLRTKSRVLGDKTYKHVTGAGECRRNQFSLLKGRPQNIVHRLEHRFHEVNFACRKILREYSSSVNISLKVVIATRNVRVASNIFKNMMM